MYSYLPIFLCSLSLLIIWAKQATANISLGSSLTAGDGSKPPWLSPSGDFAFGFQQATGGGFLAAIWFNKIPEKTITWSANRDHLAQNGSKLNLTVHGLVLSDTKGNQMWNATGSGVTYASILDRGNFVIRDKNDITLWQSFDHPTDTILPRQTMNIGAQLIARLTDTNYSSGRFKLTLQNDGNFVSYLINWPQNTINYASYFWTPWSYKLGYQVVFNQSGTVSVIGRPGNVLGNVLSSTMYSTSQYQRAILEFDGVFRRYVYPVSSSTNQSRNWTVDDFVPKNICNQTGSEGGGACGFNSYCQTGNGSKHKCSCLPGYSLFDESDIVGGCKRDFIAQSCLSEQQKDQKFVIQDVDSTTFQSQDSEVFLGILESSCRNICLLDCLCAAAVFDGQRCWKKRFPLSNGWTVTDVLDVKTFVKVGLGNSTIVFGNNQTNARENNHQGRVVLTGFFGGSIFLNIFLLSMVVLVARFLMRKEKEPIKVKQDI